MAVGKTQNQVLNLEKMLKNNKIDVDFKVAEYSVAGGQR